MIYLLLDFITLLFPLLFSFEKRIQFYRHWKFLFPAIALTVVFFVGWDILFTASGVWSFNTNYIIGVSLGNLPLEEILFFICMPYACMFIYVIMRELFIKPKNVLPVEVGFFVLAVLLLVTAILCRGETYTVVATVSLSVFVFLLLFLGVKFFTIFLAAYFIQLVPFLIINGILTALPVVMYNNAFNSGIRVFTIPIEDFAYTALLLLMNVAWYEFFRSRSSQKISV